MSVRIRRVICPVSFVADAAGAPVAGAPLVLAAAARPAVDAPPIGSTTELTTTFDSSGQSSQSSDAFPLESDQSTMTVQRRRAARAPGLPAFESLRPSTIRSLASAGEAGSRLAAEHLSALDTIGGSELRDVRIHTGEAAANVAEALGAEAFTIGRDVYFARGRFDPTSQRGRALLAHELTHVRQQTAGPDRVLGAGGVDGEAEAEATEQAVLNQSPLSGSGLSVGNYARSYASADGRPLTPGDRARLDAISQRALDACRAILGESRGGSLDGTIGSLQVDVSLDLDRLSDDEAAEIWGGAIARAVEMAVRRPDVSLPVANPDESLQLSPADDAAPAPMDYELHQRVDQVEKKYRDAVETGRQLGWDVAADNLQDFLDSSRNEKAIPVNWLRGFAVVLDAESRNLKQFEKQLGEIAAKMKDGENRNHTDYWDAAIDAPIGTELFWASGKSQLSSYGRFSLSRSGETVLVSGTVVHKWKDNYDWNPGEGVPGFSDDDALALERMGRGKRFMMTATWTSSVGGTITVRPFWFDEAELSWSANETLSEKEMARATDQLGQFAKDKGARRFRNH